MDLYKIIIKKGKTYEEKQDIPFVLFIYKL